MASLSHSAKGRSGLQHQSNLNICTSVGFEVFTAVVMKSTIFWDMTLCSPLSLNRRFGGIYRLHFQLACWFCWTYFFDPEDGGDMFLRNVGYNSTDYTASYPRRWYSSSTPMVANLFESEALLIWINKFKAPQLIKMTWNMSGLRCTQWSLLSCHQYEE
jgi:hypothetical protein